MQRAVESALDDAGHGIVVQRELLNNLPYPLVLRPVEAGNEKFLGDMKMLMQNWSAHFSACGKWRTDCLSARLPVCSRVGGAELCA